MQLIKNKKGTGRMILQYQFTCARPTPLLIPTESRSKVYSENLDVRRPITAPWITFNSKSH